MTTQEVAVTEYGLRDDRTGEVEPVPGVLQVALGMAGRHGRADARNKTLVRRVVRGHNPIISGTVLDGVSLARRDGMPTVVTFTSDWMTDEQYAALLDGRDPQ